jgi:hypothetical protein
LTAVETVQGRIKERRILKDEAARLEEKTQTKEGGKIFVGPDDNDVQMNSHDDMVVNRSVGWC